MATQEQIHKAAERMAAVAQEAEPEGAFTAEDYIDRIQNDPEITSNQRIADRQPRGGRDAAPMSFRLLFHRISLAVFQTATVD